jgi:hypothetical protein
VHLLNATDEAALFSVVGNSITLALIVQEGILSQPQLEGMILKLEHKDAPIHEKFRPLSSLF